MVRFSVAAVMAVVGLLSVSAAFAAGSGKVRQTGIVRGDAQADVRLTVIDRGGTPKSVKNVRVRNLLSDCASGPSRISLRLYDGAAKVDATRRFERTYVAGKSKVKLEGRVKPDSSGVHGSISGTTIRVAGIGRCEVPTIDFATGR